jgi:hypothetical protein
MIAKKTKIAGMALAAALLFSNVSVKAAGSRGGSTGGSAVTPLIGAYVLINKMECGGSSGFASLSSAGNATFFADAWDPYQTWRNARSLPDPTNQTTYLGLPPNHRGLRIKF